jgi:hypothetical protein
MHHALVVAKRKMTCHYYITLRHDKVARVGLRSTSHRKQHHRSWSTVVVDCCKASLSLHTTTVDAAIVVEDSVNCSDRRRCSNGNKIVEWWKRRRRRYCGCCLRIQPTLLGVLFCVVLFLAIEDGSAWMTPTTTVRMTPSLFVQSSSSRRRIQQRLLWDSVVPLDQLTNNITDSFTTAASESSVLLVDDERASLEMTKEKGGDNAAIKDGADTTSTTTMTTMSSLGDIMSSGELLDDGVKKKNLASTYGITNPLDRMALTANGNLQRLVASYYDAPVTVVVEMCQLRTTETTTTTAAAADDTAGTYGVQSSYCSSATSTTTTVSSQTWDRLVHLQVHGQTFCTATSVITVHDPLCQQLVADGKVGLGQLFRYLDLMPEFVLHDAAVATTTTTTGGGGGFWRDYTLQCAELTCRIHEDFSPGMWDYAASPANHEP